MHVNALGYILKRGDYLRVAGVDYERILKGILKKLGVQVWNRLKILRIELIGGLKGTQESSASSIGHYGLSLVVWRRALLHGVQLPVNRTEDTTEES
jgi:hypothetical protein